MRRKYKIVLTICRLQGVAGGYFPMVYYIMLVTSFEIIHLPPSSTSLLLSPAKCIMCDRDDRLLGVFVRCLSHRVHYSILYIWITQKCDSGPVRMPIIYITIHTVTSIYTKVTLRSPQWVDYREFHNRIFVMVRGWLQGRFALLFIFSTYLLPVHIHAEMMY